MALFGKKDPQRFFEGTDFVVSEVLYEPPALVPAPSIYLDAPHRRWAVRLPGAEPHVYSYDDVAACAITDDDGSIEREKLGGGGTLGDFVANPMRVSRANAAKKGTTCFVLGVVVALRDSEATIQLPYITRATPKASAVYRELRKDADHVKATFDAMVGA